MFATRLSRGLLALNAASLFRASRFGLRDASKRLKKTYVTMSPFGAEESGLELEALIPCIVANYCKGRGLEIGPGNNPRCDRDRTVFLDKFPSTQGWVRIDIVSDASTIPVPDNSFDYLFSSHCLEHMPDTIGTLKEWLRVLRPGGRLVLMLPHKERTWERRRTLATLEHHIQDHARKMDLYDFTDWDEYERAFLDEIRRLGGDRPWPWDNKSAWMPDGSLNRTWAAENGFFHYHAWTQDVLADVLKYLDLTIQVTITDVPERTDSFLIVASKPPEPGAVNGQGANENHACVTS